MPQKEQPVKKKVTRASGPHIPALYEVPDVAAIQALIEGTAEPEQQKRALDWIIKQAAGTYEFQFYPDERQTSFALGRAFVGQQIVKLTRLNLSQLRRQDG